MRGLRILAVLLRDELNPAQQKAGARWSVKIYQCRVLRDVIPPTPPGPEGSNGNGLVRAQ